MQVNVRYLDNLKLEANFDDFKIYSDQPARYKGDGTAPGPFDYFLASSAMCAAYFVKVYCKTRNIETSDITIFQNNIVDPDNRYRQIFELQIELPPHIDEKDRNGILQAMERCTVKKVIQAGPQFRITVRNPLDKVEGQHFNQNLQESETLILGKDASLESSLDHMMGVLQKIGINIEIASWRNPLPHVWSVHIRDADCPLCYTNGKGASKEAALCSALGEYIERLATNYFYNDYYLGADISARGFVHYPQEKWFPIKDEKKLPLDLLDRYTRDIYGQDQQLRPEHLLDANSEHLDRGICALPYIRQSDLKVVYFPVNLIGNLFVSNGMSAGNSKFEARVQALSEIFERAVKNKIIRDELSLPDVPKENLAQYPNFLASIKSFEERGYSLLIKDASLGGKFPVMCVTLINPKTGGVFASFGAHPKVEIALERSLTELLQGRSFEMLNDMPTPSFNSFSVTEHNNLVDHFIDSSGVLSWKFFSKSYDFDYTCWNFTGNTEEEFEHLMKITRSLEKEVYIADYEELGVYACRILVPDYSEIYEKEDLIWDNSNRSIHFRQDILNIHRLSETQLKDLVQKLDESELDPYMPVSELIGVAFDETSAWGRSDIGEVKALCHLALKDYAAVKEFTASFKAFNDALTERRRFYQILDDILEITLREDLKLSDYQDTLQKMYGASDFDNVLKAVRGEIRFPGLTKTDHNLKGLEKHQHLLESYQKVMKCRESFFHKKKGPLS